MKSLPLLLIYTIFLIIGDSVLMLALKFYFYSQYRVNALTNRRTKKKNVSSGSFGIAAVYFSQTYGTSSDRL